MSVEFVVAQLGARMHYAVPRILHSAGYLAHLYTDICSSKGWPYLLRIVPSKLRPIRLKRLLAREVPDIPPDKITGFAWFGLEYANRLSRASSYSEVIQTYLWAGSRFCELIIKKNHRNATGVYVYNSAGLELLLAAKESKLATVMEQTIAPKYIETGILRHEAELFHEWGPQISENQFDAEYIERERQEWNAADKIICGSDFVRSGVVEAGIPEEKCIVVPYGIDAKLSALQRSRHDGLLRVLTVGSVGLRKGSPYVLKAANRLKGKAIFRMVGHLETPLAVNEQLSKYLELKGAIPRSEIHRDFEWADVFLLPSLCEGSATVTYEALSAGLPVICTPNTGSIVRNGIDGYVVPIRDDETIAEKVELLASNRELLEFMSLNARERAQEFTLEKYGERLLRGIGSV